MAVLYTPEEIQEVLRSLKIRPTDDGLVTTLEAAKILTWRAKAEQEVNFVYKASAVRRHVQLKNLVSVSDSTRKNLYRVEDIFGLPLAPKRGVGHIKEANGASKIEALGHGLPGSLVA